MGTEYHNREQPREVSVSLLPVYNKTPFSCSVANVIVTLASGRTFNGSTSTYDVLCKKLKLVKYSQRFPVTIQNN